MGTEHTGIPLSGRNIQPPLTPVVKITINKTITDEISDTHIFHVSIISTNGYSALNIPITQSQPIVLQMLQYGTYTISENATTGYTQESITPTTFTLSADNPQQVVDIVNGKALALELTFDDIANVPVINASSLTDWNTFFDLPTYGTPFTSVEIVDNVVKLFGGSGITIKDSLFENNIDLISVYDKANCIISIGESAFSNNIGTYYVFPKVTSVDSYAFYNGEYITTLEIPLLESAATQSFRNLLGIIGFDFQHLTYAGDGCFFSCKNVITFNLPNLITAGDTCFNDCSSVTSYSFPELTTIGWETFGVPAPYTSLNIITTSINLPKLISIPHLMFAGLSMLSNIYISSCTTIGATTGNNFIFYYLTGQIITLTIPSSLMTCNGGNPDGDIQYLIDNNTVTIFDPDNNQIYP